MSLSQWRQELPRESFTFENEKKKNFFLKPEKQQLMFTFCTFLIFYYNFFPIGFVLIASFFDKMFEIPQRCFFFFKKLKKKLGLQQLWLFSAWARSWQPQL